MPHVVLNPGERIEVHFSDSDGIVVVAFDLDAFRVFVVEDMGSDRIIKVYEDVFLGTAKEKSDGRPLVGMQPPEDHWPPDQETRPSASL